MAWLTSRMLCVACGNTPLPILVKVSNKFSPPCTVSCEKSVVCESASAMSFSEVVVSPDTSFVDFKTWTVWAATNACFSVTPITSVPCSLRKPKAPPTVANPSSTAAKARACLIISPKPKPASLAPSPVFLRLLPDSSAFEPTEDSSDLTDLTFEVKSDTSALYFTSKSPTDTVLTRYLLPLWLCVWLPRSLLLPLLWCPLFPVGRRQSTRGTPSPSCARRIHLL